MILPQTATYMSFMDKAFWKKLLFFFKESWIEYIYTPQAHQSLPFLYPLLVSWEWCGYNGSFLLSVSHHSDAPLAFTVECGGVCVWGTEGGSACLDGEKREHRGANRANNSSGTLALSLSHTHICWSVFKVIVIRLYRGGILITHVEKDTHTHTHTPTLTFLHMQTCKHPDVYTHTCSLHTTEIL